MAQTPGWTYKEWRGPGVSEGKWGSLEHMLLPGAFMEYSSSSWWPVALFIF